MEDGGERARPELAYDGSDLGFPEGSLFLFFRLSETGFPSGTSTATLKWERHRGGAHGLSATGPIRLGTAPDPEATNPDVDVLNYALTLEHLEYAFYLHADVGPKFDTSR